jgi:hypothetical protein
MSFFINLKFSWWIDQESKEQETRIILIRINSNIKILNGLNLSIDSFIPGNINFNYNWLNQNEINEKDQQLIRIRDPKIKTSTINLCFEQSIDSDLTLSDTESDPRTKNKKVEEIDSV